MLRVYIDVETTGIERSKGAAIIEVGAVVFAGTTELASYASLCNPGPGALNTFEADGALAISGITAEQVLEAPSVEDVAAAFRKFLEEFGTGATLHAYNVAFDSKFLADEPWAIAKGLWDECVMVVAQHAMGLTRFVKLQIAADHFHVPRVVGHRALVDARTCGLIHQAILAARQVPS